MLTCIFVMIGDNEHNYQKNSNGKSEDNCVEESTEWIACSGFVTKLMITS